jgi:DNA ligase 3
MLADACKSVEQAMKKCPNGMFAEIKYDGERLQVHKNGSKFDYFSRNLKQVSPHKTVHLKEFIPKAFPNGDQLIFDGEILLYDTKEQKPLPFGTLGVHKKNSFKDATVCLFIFDCLLFNGKSLMNEPIEERRRILEKNIKEIPGRVMLSEKKFIKSPEPLRKLMMNAIKQGLEGLVLKDIKSIYEPGKRHWLKMKKDYLDEGSMADTADLVVLGAYYGTGSKGGMKSVFLMGVFDEKTNKWHTVTKVGNGFDDKTLEKLQKQIEMVEIKKDPSKIPDWLDIHRSIVPDFLVKNVKKSPVWELTGAEFSKSDIHTASGISIRFPRVTRIRDDKTWKEATSLKELKKIFEVSKEKSDIVDDEEDDGELMTFKKSSPKKRTSLENSDDVTPKKLKKDENEDESMEIPSIFDNIIFYISKDVSNIKKLKRYIQA